MCNNGVYSRVLRTMQAVYTLASQSQRGRPRVGPPSEIDKERGRRVTAWIRAGITPPAMPFELKNADIARMTKISPSTVQYLMNDCYEPTEDRMKLPTDETLEKLANGLKLSLTEGMKARNYVPPAKVRESGTITYLPNTDTQGFIERYSDLEPTNKHLVEVIVNKLYDAQRSGSIGARHKDDNEDSDSE